MSSNIAFINAMTIKYPNLDIKSIFEMFDNEISEIKKTTPENSKKLRFPLDSDLNKNIFLVVLNQYLTTKTNDTI